MREEVEIVVERKRNNNKNPHQNHTIKYYFIFNYHWNDNKKLWAQPDLFCLALLLPLQLLLLLLLLLLLFLVQLYQTIYHSFMHSSILNSGYKYIQPKHITNESSSSTHSPDIVPMNKTKRMESKLCLMPFIMWFLDIQYTYTPSCGPVVVVLIPSPVLSSYPI